MQCWQEQQLSSHREMYLDGHECDRDGIAHDAAAQNVEGRVKSQVFCRCVGVGHLVHFGTAFIKV